jgi:hypothetical protein
MRKCATTLLLGLLALAAPAAAGDAGSGCQDETTRARAALLRARRSQARAHIAVLRITAELRSIGKAPAATLPAEEEPASTVSPPAEAELATLALATWEIKRQTVERSGKALALMKPYEVRRLTALELGPHFPDQEEELLKPAGDEATSCRAWIYYAQRGAFRAEQAAQLAEVAADQAIALAKLERERIGR